MPGLTYIAINMRGRTGRAAIQGVPVVVIASDETQEQGQGMFTQFLTAMKAECEKQQWMLKLENVLTDRFRGYLKREGFVFTSNEITASGYWIPDGLGTTIETGSLPG